MAFVIDFEKKKVVFTVEQEISFEEILEQYAWQSGYGDAETLGLSEADVTDLLHKISKTYDHIIDLGCDEGYLEDAIGEVLLEEDDDYYSSIAKPILGSSKRRENPPEASKKPPEEPVEEPPLEDPEEPATPEDVVINEEGTEI